MSSPMDVTDQSDSPNKQGAAGPIRTPLTVSTFLNWLLMSRLQSLPDELD